MKATNILPIVNDWLTTEQIKKFSQLTNGVEVVFIYKDEQQYKLTLEPYNPEDDKDQDN